MDEDTEHNTRNTADSLLCANSFPYILMPSSLLNPTFTHMSSTTTQLVLKSNYQVISNSPQLIVKVKWQVLLKRKPVNLVDFLFY